MLKGVEAGVGKDVPPYATAHMHAEIEESLQDSTSQCDEDLVRDAFKHLNDDDEEEIVYMRCVSCSRTEFLF